MFLSERLNVLQVHTGTRKITVHACEAPTSEID